jgi:chitinase
MASLMCCCPDIDKPFPDDGLNPPFRGCFWQSNNPDGAIRKRNPNLQVLISLGGWTLSRGFSDAASSDQTKAEQSRRKLVDSIVVFLERSKVDGIGKMGQASAMWCDAEDGRD